MPGPLPSVHSSTPPPRALSQSPPNISNKASLSALLHPNPTPSSSEPNSASAGGNNSATSSPRGTGAVISGGAAAGLMAKGFHEDARALDVLNKKFSI